MSRRVGIALAVLLLIGIALWSLRGGDSPVPPSGREGRAAAGEGSAPRPGGDAANRPVDRPPPAMPGSASGSGAVEEPPFEAALRDVSKLETNHLPSGLSSEQQRDLLIRIALEHPDASERAWAIHDLSLEDDLVPVLPVLQQLVDDPDPEIRSALLSALEQLGEAAPPDVLAKLATDPDPDLRSETLTLVQTLAEDDIMPGLMMPILQNATRDPNEDVREQAKDSLRELAQLRGEEVEEEEEEE